MSANFDNKDSQAIQIPEETTDQERTEATAQDLECPQDYPILHFLMYFSTKHSNEFKGLPEINALSKHMLECPPCQRMHDEMDDILTGMVRPSRMETLSYLRNAYGGSRILLNASLDKVLRKSHKKTKALEQRVQQLEVMMAMILTVLAGEKLDVMEAEDYVS